MSTAVMSEGWNYRQLKLFSLCFYAFVTIFFFLQQTCNSFVIWGEMYFSKKTQ